eukprot:TRINITY_DN6491_c0_g1_i1.p1 TRINITY_DN6491_c0_g1~~TRINITY_DN6491_c0_g1_i1.p1  ORF type:complete len:787 (-),score=97.39 TRINITY_DN6491_c0_g1_i1:49-2409(-)
MYPAGCALPAPRGQSGRSSPQYPALPRRRTEEPSVSLLQPVQAETHESQLEQTRQAQLPLQSRSNFVSEASHSDNGTCNNGMVGIPDGFKCPIGKYVMREPVLASDGHVYEHGEIEKWLQMGNRRSPVTGAELDSLNVTPHPALKAAIQAFVSHPLAPQKPSEDAAAVRNCLYEQSTVDSGSQATTDVQATSTGGTTNCMTSSNDVVPPYHASSERFLVNDPNRGLWQEGSHLGSQQYSDPMAPHRNNVGCPGNGILQATSGDVVCPPRNAGVIGSRETKLNNRSPSPQTRDRNRQAIERHVRTRSASPKGRRIDEGGGGGGGGGAVSAGQHHSSLKGTFGNCGPNGNTSSRASLARATPRKPGQAWSSASSTVASSRAQSPGSTARTVAAAIAAVSEHGTTHPRQQRTTQASSPSRRPGGVAADATRGTNGSANAGVRRSQSRPSVNGRAAKQQPSSTQAQSQHRQGRHGHTDSRPSFTASRSQASLDTSMKDRPAEASLLGASAMESVHLDSVTSLSQAQAHYDPHVTPASQVAADPVTPGNAVAEIDEAGRTPLMHAAGEGDVDAVRRYLAQGADVDAKDECLCTALMYAATYGHCASVRCLVESGASVEATSKDGWTPLVTAAYNGHVDVIQYLLQQGARIEAADERGWTSLMHVAFNGDSRTLHVLLENGANVHAMDADGRTALVYAAFNGHLENVRSLLRSPAKALPSSASAADGARDTALLFASIHGHLEVVRELLEVSSASAETRHAALKLAADHGHHSVVELLVRRSAVELQYGMNK